MLVEIPDEVLKQLSDYTYALNDDDEQGQVFGFWSVDGLLSAAEEIIAAAERTGWTRPPDETRDDSGEDE